MYGRESGLAFPLRGKEWGAMPRIRFGWTLEGVRKWHPGSAVGESSFGSNVLLTNLKAQQGMTHLDQSIGEPIL